MTKETEGNKDRWQGVKGKENQDKAVDVENGPIAIILIDFPHSVKAGLEPILQMKRLIVKGSVWGTVSGVRWRNEDQDCYGLCQRGPESHRWCS